MTAIDAGRRDAIDGQAAAIMVALTLIWGSNQVVIKIASTGYDPILLTVVRSAIASALVFLWCRLRGVALFERDGTMPGGLLAGAMFGVEFALIFAGLEYTTAARGTLLINTMPFWALIGAHFLLGERMSLRAVAGLVLAFAGVVLVFSDSLTMPTPKALLGDLMMVVAGALWAGTTLVIRRSKLATASPEKTLLYQLAVSMVVVAPLLVFAGPLLREVSVAATAALLYQSAIVVSITFLIWFSLVARYPAASLSSFAFLTPVFGVMAGGYFLGEPLSWKIVVALILIGLGLIIVNRPSRRMPPAA